jgi:hypothetical protein
VLRRFDVDGLCRFDKSNDDECNKQSGAAAARNVAQTGPDASGLYRRLATGLFG